MVLSVPKEALFKAEARSKKHRVKKTISEARPLTCSLPGRGCPVERTEKTCPTALALEIPRQLEQSHDPVVSGFDPPDTAISWPKVDTAERWQGLERGLMIVVHPLSGVVAPSAFDLETGRLCVMASRHLCGLIVVRRDHLDGTLDDFIPSAAQAIGRPDATGRGHAQHLGFWTRLAKERRVVAA